jgi:hypothetical protein
VTLEGFTLINVRYSLASQSQQRKEPLMKKDDKQVISLSSLPDPEVFARRAIAGSRRKMTAVLLMEWTFTAAAGICGAIVLLKLSKWLRLKEATIATVLIAAGALCVLLAAYFFYRYIEAAMKENDGDW